MSVKYLPELKNCMLCFQRALLCTDMNNLQAILKRIEGLTICKGVLCVTTNSIPLCICLEIVNRAWCYIFFILSALLVCRNENAQYNKNYFKFKLVN